MRLSSSLSWLALTFGAARAVQLDLGNAGAIQKAAQQAITNLLKMYQPGNSGAFNQVQTPWFASWDMLFDYQRWSGDDQFAGIATGALANSSFGTMQDILGGNGQTANLLGLEGFWNDDIAWCATAIQTGGEIYGYENTMPNAGGPWSTVPSKTMDEVFSQGWNDACGGGLLWTRNPNAASAGYKSAITNWEAVALNSRIFLANGNATALQRAKDVYSWLFSSQLAMTSTAKSFDGMDSGACGTITDSQWTYNYGQLLAASTWLSQATKDDSYISAASPFLATALATFANNNSPIKEVCEANGNCNRDQQHFKAVLVRQLAYYYRATTNTTDQQAIKTALTNSVSGMLNGCDSNWNCGGNWTTDTAPTIYPSSQHVSSALLTAALSVFASQTGPGLMPKAEAGSLTVSGTAPTTISGQGDEGSIESSPLSPASKVLPPMLATSLITLSASFFLLTTGSSSGKTWTT